MGGGGTPQLNNGDAPSVCEAFTTSVHIFWKRFESDIKDAAVRYATFWPQDQSNNTMFNDWINQLFQHYYQSYQLRRSSIHPPGLVDTLKILEIITKRVNYLRNKESLSSSPVVSAPPLHIMVTGGSVPAGTDCWRNHIGLRKPSYEGKCAWPRRLQDLFNHVLFQGKNVVKVSNLAVGKSSSAIGKFLLEYQLFPDGFELPHIVIWSHVVNDARAPDKNKAYFEDMPGYVNAAHKLRLCDDNLPLVVMNEEFFREFQSNEISGMIYKVSNWFGLMGISHRNVISHITFANSDKPEFLDTIVGARRGIHPGMAGHIGVAWTVFYNFISAFSDACDYKRISSPQTTVGGRIVTNRDDVNAKSIGFYKETELPTSAEWKEHQTHIREECRSQQQQQQGPCTYAFLVNRISSVRDENTLNKKMNEVLASNVGWKADGNLGKNLGLGWFAQEANAHFSLKIDNVAIATKYVTIVSMESYGDNFQNTTLEVDVRIEKLEQAAAAMASAGMAVAKYKITGYHTTKTSIHVPHKFELPNGGALVGDSIVVDFHLVSGSYFKIVGLAFCRY